MVDFMRKQYSHANNNIMIVITGGFCQNQCSVGGSQALGTKCHNGWELNICKLQ